MSIDKSSKENEMLTFLGERINEDKQHLNDLEKALGKQKLAQYIILDTDVRIPIAKPLVALINSEILYNDICARESALERYAQFKDEYADSKANDHLAVLHALKIPITEMLYRYLRHPDFDWEWIDE